MDIPGDNILKHHFPDVPISNVLKLEGIANRDSLPYADTYGLGRLDDLRTVLRGTLRCADPNIPCTHLIRDPQIPWVC